MTAYEGRRLAVSGWFPYGTHIGYRKVNTDRKTKKNYGKAIA